jgi:hypothetical protein
MNRRPSRRAGTPDETKHPYSRTSSRSRVRVSVSWWAPWWTSWDSFQTLGKPVPIMRDGEQQTRLAVDEGPESVKIPSRSEQSRGRYHVSDIAVTNAAGMVDALPARPPRLHGFGLVDVERASAAGTGAIRWPSDTAPCSRLALVAWHVLNTSFLMRPDNHWGA